MHSISCYQTCNSSACVLELRNDHLISNVRWWKKSWMILFIKSVLLDKFKKVPFPPNLKITRILSPLHISFDSILFWWFLLLWSHIIFYFKVFERCKLFNREIDRNAQCSTVHPSYWTIIHFIVYYTGYILAICYF